MRLSHTSLPLPELGGQKGPEGKLLPAGHRFFHSHPSSSLLPLSRTKLDSSQITQASEKGECLGGPYCWVEPRLDLALVLGTLLLSHPLGEDFRAQCRGQPLPTMSQQQFPRQSMADTDDGASLVGWGVAGQSLFKVAEC